MSTLIKMFLYCAGMVGVVYITYQTLWHIEERKCVAEWEDSGMLYSYTVPGGCKVSQDGKTYLPASAYRRTLP